MTIKYSMHHLTRMCPEKCVVRQFMRTDINPEDLPCCTPQLCGLACCSLATLDTAGSCNKVVSVYLNIENIQGKYSIKDKKMALLYKALMELWSSQDWKLLW